MNFPKGFDESLRNERKRKALIEEIEMLERDIERTEGKIEAIKNQIKNLE